MKLFGIAEKFFNFDDSLDRECLMVFVLLITVEYEQLLFCPQNYFHFCHKQKEQLKTLSNEKLFINQQNFNYFHFHFVSKLFQFEYRIFIERKINKNK